MNETNPGANISGVDSLLYIKRSTDTDYLLVACQVDYDFQEDRAVSKNTTKCGISKNFAPKDATLSLNGEARVDIAVGDEALSYNELSELMDTNEVFSGKIVDPNEKIYIKGDMKLQKLGLTSNSTEAVKFTANFEYTDPGAIDKTPTT